MSKIKQNSTKNLKPNSAKKQTKTIDIDFLKKEWFGYVNLGFVDKAEKIRKLAHPCKAEFAQWTDEGENYEWMQIVLESLSIKSEVFNVELASSVEYLAQDKTALMFKFNDFKEFMGMFKAISSIKTKHLLGLLKRDYNVDLGQTSTIELFHWFNDQNIETSEDIENIPEEENK